MTPSRLRFMADECCDFTVVRSLRAADYDVYAVGEVMQHSVDRSLIELAAEEDRILLTEDKDFGWLVYASNVSSAGVILIRYPGNARQQLANTVLRLVSEQGERLTAALLSCSLDKYASTAVDETHKTTSTLRSNVLHQP